MRSPAAVALVLLGFVLPLAAQAPGGEAPPGIVIEAAPLGDGDAGVVCRVTFRYQIPTDVPPGVPVEIQGSILHQQKVVRNFRHTLRPDERQQYVTIQILPVGEVEIEARLMIPFEETTPAILLKSNAKLPIAATGTAYVAAETDGAEAFVAEGVVPETSGAIRLLPPRRSLAPNLFIVEVETHPPVRRVEFYAEGKKIFTRNAPPYRAELDLGSLPRRVEVRAVGYDDKGRYVDADAWIVNERETPLEVKITRTVTPDGVSHFKVSVQNAQNVAIRSVVFYAGDKKLHEWTRPPYAIDIPNDRLKGVDYVRASATNGEGLEATDLLFMDGARYLERVEVNAVELPVSVVDAAGNPVADLTKEEFEVYEGGKLQKIADFGFSSNLPLSLGVLVDHSGSMKERIKDARQAAIKFFEQIVGPRDRAFFGGFAWDASTISPLVGDVASLRMQVDTMPEAEGGTALYDAIVSGLYRFRTVPGRKALVIVSDGEDTVSRIPFDEMLTYVRASRVPLYFIGIGISFLDRSASSKMRGLAAETGGVTYFIKDIDALGETYRQLETELRMQYLITYYTEAGSDDRKYRTIEVKTKRPELRVRTIRGFIP